MNFFRRGGSLLPAAENTEYSPAAGLYAADICGIDRFIGRPCRRRGNR